LGHPAGPIQVCDETLRDGLQATYVRHPTLDEKFRLLTMMDALGIDLANVGFPAAGEHHHEDAIAIGKARANRHFRLGLRCIARSLISDVEAVLEVAEKS